jgi:hypothetical protein
MDQKAWVLIRDVLLEISGVLLETKLIKEIIL